MSLKASDTGPIPWTTVGIQRFANATALLEQRYRTLFADLNNERGGELSMTEGAQADTSGQKLELGVVAKQLDDAQKFLNRLRPIPRIHSTTRACTGLVVGYRHLDDDVVDKRGTSTERFLLGGPDESDTDSKLRTYSCFSPLGRAVKGHEVGDIVMVLTPSGETYDIEITSIVQLDSELLVEARTSIRTIQDEGLVLTH